MGAGEVLWHRRPGLEPGRAHQRTHRICRQHRGVHGVVIVHHGPGDQVQPVALLRGVEVQIGVGVVELLLLILHQCAEHGAGLHVMAVDQRILVGEVRAIDVVHEDGAVLVPCAVQQAIEVVVVVLRLHDGVVQARVRPVEPRHDVAVDAFQRRKVHVDLLRLPLRLLIAAQVRDVDVFAGILQHLVALVLFQHIAADLIGCKEKYTYEYRQQDIVYRFLHTGALPVDFLHYTRWPTAFQEKA